MKIKMKLLVFIMVAVFFTAYFIFKPVDSNEQIVQKTLEKMPFNFTDINIGDSCGKLNTLDTERMGTNEIQYLADTIEFDCIQKANLFTFLRTNDTTAYYIFYEDKLINKKYIIKEGEILLDYLVAKLTEEYGQPQQNSSLETHPQNRLLLLASTPPTMPQFNLKYKWDMGDFTISVRTATSEGRNIGDLEISFAIKDDVLVKRNETELSSKLKDINSLRFDRICSFYNGYSIGSICGTWVLIDQTRNEVRMYRNFDVFDYSYARYGLLILSNKLMDPKYNKHLYRFTDIDGKTLIDNVHSFRRSPDGKTMVVESGTGNAPLFKQDIVYIKDNGYTLMPTDFESIGYFSSDGFAKACSSSDSVSHYKLIDRDGRTVQEYKDNSIMGYFNGGTLLCKHTNSGEWYYVIGDKSGNILSKDEYSKNHDGYGFNDENMFERFGILLSHLYKDEKWTELIAENSKGQTIYRDTTSPLANIQILQGVLKITKDNKELYYDHNGSLIEGVSQCMAIPCNGYFKNAYPVEAGVVTPSVIKQYELSGESNYTTLGDFYYTYVKTFYGDRVYSYNGLQCAFPGDYELDISKCLYDGENILIAARDRIRNKYGVVDIKGNIVFEFKYDNIHSIVSPDSIQIGDELFDRTGRKISGGLKALEYRCDSAIVRDNQGLNVLNLSGKPIIKGVKVIE